MSCHVPCGRPRFYFLLVNDITMWRLLCSSAFLHVTILGHYYPISACHFLTAEDDQTVTTDSWTLRWHVCSHINHRRIVSLFATTIIESRDDDRMLASGSSRVRPRAPTYGSGSGHVNRTLFCSVKSDSPRLRATVANSNSWTSCSTFHLNAVYFLFYLHFRSHL